MQQAMSSTTSPMIPIEKEEMKVMNKEEDGAIWVTVLKQARAQLSEDPLKNALDLSDEDVNPLNLNGVLGGKISNFSKGGLDLLADKNWSGSFLKKYAKHIKFLTLFLATGKECQAGVVYAGKNHHGLECGWLLAWSYSNSEKKVYVECGPKDNFYPVNWEEVEQKLKASTWYSNYTDPSTGTKAHAAIISTGGKAALAAFFRSLKGQTNEEEAIVDESAKEFGKVAAPVATAAVSLKNLTWGKSLRFYEKKDWSGSVMGSYPLSISREGSGTFVEVGIYPRALNGSKGAVVYAGSNIVGGVENCAWLLAWHVANDGSPNKVFVTAGDLRLFNPLVIDWNFIESKLDASHHKSYYIDEETRGEANAHIGYGNAAAVAAVFDVNFGDE